MNWSLNITITLVGLVIVFGSLLLLSLCISLYPKIFIKQNKKTIKQSKIVVDNDEIDEDEIIAVIAAAIAEENAEYTSNIIVKKIHRIADSNPIWNTTGRLESLN